MERGAEKFKKKKRKWTWSEAGFKIHDGQLTHPIRNNGAVRRVENTNLCYITDIGCILLMKKKRSSKAGLQTCPFGRLQQILRRILA